MPAVQSASLWFSQLWQDAMASACFERLDFTSFRLSIHKLIKITIFCWYQVFFSWFGFLEALCLYEDSLLIQGTLGLLCRKRIWDLPSTSTFFLYSCAVYEGTDSAQCKSNQKTVCQAALLLTFWLCYTDDMSAARAGVRGQDTIAPSTAACLYFGCMSQLPGSLAARADLNQGVCAPVGSPACLCWNLYFCCCVASLLRELVWLNTNCCCIRVVHQAV